MEFRILGPVEAWEGGRRLVVAGERQRALLALLLLNANRVVSNEQLIDELWGDEPPATGAKAVQVRVSQLRRVLQEQGVTEPVVVTRGGGYTLELEPEQLDALRFDHLVHEADREAATDDHAAAAACLRDALALWRGAPLGDIDAPFAAQAAARLEELRLAAVERRIDADLATGRHHDVIGELKELVAADPYRERLRAQLMLSLYRSGRQAEALEAYRDGARRFVDELGIEPGRALQELEGAILRQDASLHADSRREPSSPTPGDRPTGPETGAILVAPGRLDALPRLLAVAAPLTRGSDREIVMVSLPGESGDLAGATAELEAHRLALVERDVRARAAAFTSSERVRDLVRLSADHAFDLLLLEAPSELLRTGAPPQELMALWDEMPCDVAILEPDRDGRVPLEGGRPVIVPFGGNEHEWAALEIGARIAAAHRLPLRLLGSRAQPERGKRDASRLLAGVSLVVQRATGITAEPMLVEPGRGAAVDAAADAGLVVVGISEQWREAGVGETRIALLRVAGCATLLVRRGPQPATITPLEGLTRYTWSSAGPSI